MKYRTRIPDFSRNHGTGRGGSALSQRAPGPWFSSGHSPGLAGLFRGQLGFLQPPNLGSVFPRKTAGEIHPGISPRCSSMSWGEMVASGGCRAGEDSGAARARDDPFWTAARAFGPASRAAPLALLQPTPKFMYSQLPLLRKRASASSVPR